MRVILLLFAMSYVTACNSPSTDEQDIEAIKSLMEVQKEAWSAHDFERFMGTYLKSDSLTFFSGGKITHGWEATLENYIKRFPTVAHTGELDFTLHSISKINKDAYWVMGEYHLSRTLGNTNGTFMVIFKRVDGVWKIVADSSC